VWPTDPGPPPGPEGETRIHCTEPLGCRSLRRESDRVD
jgi:hypothetical protein